jgi:signal transduction histidine kinase
MPRLFVPRRRSLVAVAVIALAAVIGFLAWDADRESDAAVQRLLHSHRLVAVALAQDFANRLASLERTEPKDPVAREDERERLLARALEDGRRIEREGDAVVLVQVPEHAGFRTTDGGIVSSAPIEAALARGESGVILSRDEAGSLGLPHRIAVAALASVDDASGLPPIRIAVLGSAREQRDRFRNYELRSIEGIAIASAIVLAFAGLVLREQRRQLVLDANLERERIARERDEHLADAERMASLAALSLGIGHELATPLGVILGRVEQLRATTTDERAAKALGSIEEQVSRIRSVLQGFLSLARGEAPAMETVLASRIVADATALVRHRFSSGGVRLRTVLPDDAEVRCDKTLFPQVLVNLLVNACDHSDAGSEVVLRVQKREDLVSFLVLDSGEGISPESAQRATDPFFTTRRTTGGSGLGLTIAREIVQHHGGTLRVEPRSGVPGTEAEATLPLGKEAKPDA